RHTFCRRPRASGDPYSRGGGHGIPLPRGRHLCELVLGIEARPNYKKVQLAPTDLTPTSKRTNDARSPCSSDCSFSSISSSTLVRFWARRSPSTPRPTSFCAEH